MPRRKDALAKMRKRIRDVEDNLAAPADDSPTLDDLFVVYYEWVRHHAKRTAEIEAKYRRYFHAIGEFKASELRPTVVSAWHIVIGEKHGKPTANHCLRLLRTIFNHADRMEITSGRNPGRGIKTFRERSRTRFITASEMPGFLAAVEEHASPKTRAVIYIALFTGARIGRVVSMRYEDIDLQGAVWTIPDSKNGDNLAVALLPPIVEMLRERQPYSQHGWVFPSDSPRNKDGHIQPPRGEWERIIKAAEIPDITWHDLRRTCGSWQACTGASLLVIAQSLGHRNIASTQIYARLNLDPVRASLQKAVASMLETACGARAAEVRATLDGLGSNKEGVADSRNLDEKLSDLKPEAQKRRLTELEAATFIGRDVLWLREGRRRHFGPPYVRERNQIYYDLLLLEEWMEGKRSSKRRPKRASYFGQIEALRKEIEELKAALSEVSNSQNPQLKLVRS